MMMVLGTKAAEILLIEDSPTDVFLAREALRDASVSNRLHLVSDGVEAMAFLNRLGRYHEKPRPDLILLDLNLPRKDGREVLTEIKSDPRFQDIPVVVLTTSRAASDVDAAYGRHANCYILKPVDYDEFAKVVQRLLEFWFSVVTLPGQE